MELGPRIRTLRTQRRLTLQQLAQSCGLTKSMLSKLENGRASPSIAALTRIATALGVGLTVLLSEGEGPQTEMISAGQIAGAWKTTEKGYDFAALAAGRVTKAMQPILFVAKRGKVRPGALHHRGEEFIYVLDGRMAYTVGRKTYELGPGDSLYFNSTEIHDLKPLSAKVKYLAVMAELPAASDIPATRTARKKRRTRPSKK